MVGVVVGDVEDVPLIVVLGKFAVEGVGSTVGVGEGCQDDTTAVTGSILSATEGSMEAEG